MYNNWMDDYTANHMQMTIRTRHFMCPFIQFALCLFKHLDKWWITTGLTVNQAVARFQVADDADGSDGEHAAQAKDEAAEAVVYTRDVFSQPGVMKRGHDGERVEADAAEEVNHGQVDAQHLRPHHLLPPAVTDHQNQPIAQNREKN